MATALIRSKVWLRALVVGLFGAAILSSVDSCPEMCRCQGDVLVAVDCSGRQLREIPDGIPQTTFSL